MKIRKKLALAIAILIILVICVIEFCYIGWCTLSIEDYGTLKVPSSWSYTSNNGQINIYNKDGELVLMQMKHNEVDGYTLYNNGQTVVDNWDVYSGGISSNMAQYGKIRYMIGRKKLDNRCILLQSLSFAPQMADTVLIATDVSSPFVLRKISRSFSSDRICMSMLLEGIEKGNKQLLEDVFGDTMNALSSMPSSINNLLELFPSNNYSIQWLDSANLTCPQTSVNNSTFTYNVYSVDDKYIFIVIGYPNKNDKIKALYVSSINEYNNISALTDLASLNGIVFDTKSK